MHRLSLSRHNIPAQPWPPVVTSLVLVTAMAVLWDMGPGDLAMMRWIGTPQGFALRRAWLLETVLHDALRHVCSVLWVLLAAWALWPDRGRLGRLRVFSVPRSERLWVLTLVSLSLLVVGFIKARSLTSCPWDLALFGGQARYVSHWSLSLTDGGPGRCFPGGHASSGFGFVALCLPWLLPPSGSVRASAPGWRWLALIVSVGLVAGTVQTLRGAHYPSHTLWTLVICGAVSVTGWRLAQRGWLRG
jgi:membrane-associated PAP2 superfamily phosphatase